MGESEARRGEDDGGGGGCEFCGGESAAVVYCRADTARLCLACDRHVHAANSVSSRHHRSLLCDACRKAPAAFLSSSTVLCSNCDFDANSGIEGRGICDRKPIEPFSGYPSASELATVLGVDGDEKLVFLGEEESGGGDEGWVWETGPVVKLEDLVPTTSAHGFQAMAILPPLPKPKNRNLACGEHKEEILRQLCELIKSETYVSNDYKELEPLIEFQSHMQHENHQQGNLCSDFDLEGICMSEPNYEMMTFQWNNTDAVSFTFEQLMGGSSYVDESFLDGTASFETTTCDARDTEKDVDHPVTKDNISSSPPIGGLELGCTDRDFVISRYKEKRKTRRYDKQIRYESRKVRADCRVRIKGRFAKET